jgi:hypothetical protein
VIHQVVTQVTALDWPSFVEQSALRADSFLARLPEDDFHQGMALLRAHGDKIDTNAPVTEEIDWFVFARPRYAQGTRACFEHREHNEKGASGVLASS